jgi:hypothetical protein
MRNYSFSFAVHGTGVLLCGGESEGPCLREVPQYQIYIYIYIYPVECIFLPVITLIFFILEG